MRTCAASCCRSIEPKACRSASRCCAKLRPTQVIPETPRNAEPRTGMSMGEHAAITARQWGISREEQDQLAVVSHRNLAAAWSRGFFDDLATPYLGLQKDQNIRPEIGRGQVVEE